MELNADVPYPSLDGIGEDACSLRIISPAYAGRAGELTAILQYVYQHILFERMGDEEAAETLLAVSVAEMRHFEILGTLICKLGAPPVFTNCPPYPVGYYSASAVDYSSTPQKMLLADIAADRFNGLLLGGEQIRHVQNTRSRIVVGQSAGINDGHIQGAGLQRLAVLSLAAQLTVGVELHIQRAAGLLHQQFLELLRHLHGAVVDRQVGA